ncbi:MAG TPA: hypothetical protein PLH97_15530, partial [Verrucomicrobiota bacterium]|nr:hypothetical protein [Verrucomicrobiota bacterium]
RAALAAQRIATLRPGWMNTHFGLALSAASSLFLSESETGKPASLREIIVVTDLQEGAKVDGLQGLEWPNGVQVTLERVDARRRANAGVNVLQERSTAAGPAGLQVRLANARDSGREQFRLGWVGPGGALVGQTIDIYLPPGQTRTFLAPPQPEGVTSGSLRLVGDEQDFDNTCYYVAPEVREVRIAYFGVESAADPRKPLFYLQRVFVDTPRRKIEFLTGDSNAPLTAAVLDRASLAVIARPLPAEESSRAREWIRGGKTALLLLTEPAMGDTLAAVSGVAGATLSEVDDRFVLLGEIDFRHPIFTPFADPRYSDFTQIHFWKHRRWELPEDAPARVLARFDDGSPALAEVDVGGGRLLVLTSGWHPEDSQLAVASKFPPLMHTILNWSGAAVPVRQQFFTGDAIPSPVEAGGPVQWRKPDGSTVELAAGTVFTETDAPGIYSAMGGGKETRFAVELVLDESRTAPMLPDELARLGVPLASGAQFASAVPTAEQRRYLHSAEMESQQKLWRPVLLALLAVMLIEVILSGWLARRVKPAETPISMTGSPAEAVKS